MRWRCVMMGVLGALSAPLAAVELGPYFREPQTVFSTEHLRVVVPQRLQTALHSTAGELERLFAHLAAEADYHSTAPLWVALSADGDGHNGFSTTVPRPLVQIDLAPADPTTSLFAPLRDLERTAIHEFAHHISNDRHHGVGRGMERIFGRILPNDALSMLLALFTTPAHVFMPRFWHEGLGIWAETSYGSGPSTWRGRGADPLTHLQWRVDAAGTGIPAPEHWRLSYPRWPYGTRAYSYGSAYLRYLAGQGIAIWELIERQGKQKPFLFSGGARRLVTESHARLMAAARQALQVEQAAILESLRTVPTTQQRRLSPPDCVVGEPCWLDDERLLLAQFDPDRGVQLVTYAARTGRVLARRRLLGRPGSLRADDGVLAYSTDDHRQRARLVLEEDGQRVRNTRLRLREAAVLRWADGRLGVAALATDAQARPQLVRFDLDRIADLQDLDRAGLRPVPTTGQVWSPALGRDATGAPLLLWVEYDAREARLIVADPAGAERRILHRVAARILRPRISNDGRSVLFCSDVSGVPNAWRVSLEGDGPAEPLSHTLGGILAWVPAPQGTAVALVDHDQHGPYLAVADAPQPPQTLPQIDCAWPARGGGRPDPVIALDDAEAAVLAVDDYHAFPQLRFHYWTPTTVINEADGPALVQRTTVTGLGILAEFSDPLRTTDLHLAAGVSNERPAGRLRLAQSTWALDVVAQVEREQRDYADALRVIRSDRLTLQDYEETLDEATLRVGRFFQRREQFLSGSVQAGYADWQAVDKDQLVYGDWFGRPIFTGDEYYAEAALGLGERRQSPDGFSVQEGWTLGLTGRVSAGDLERTRLIGSATTWLPIWRRRDHVIQLSLAAGWSDGDRFVQGNFSGGPAGTDDEVRGDYYLAWYTHYAFPIWRPFQALSTIPIVHRQVHGRFFAQGEHLSLHGIGHDGVWRRSIGTVVDSEWEFWLLRLTIGLGFAQDLDGEEEQRVFLDLGSLL